MFVCISHPDQNTTEYLHGKTTPEIPYQTDKKWNVFITNITDIYIFFLSLCRKNSF